MSVHNENLERILERALERPEAERRSFVDEQCGDDAELRQLLLTLLKHHAEANTGGFLESRPDLPVTEILGHHDGADGPATRGNLPPPAGYVLTAAIADSDTRKPRYTLTRLHAEGGLGQVWVARDEQLHRDVAFKQLHARQSTNPDAWHRFLKEAQVTGQLGHPNIVPVYELGRDENDRPFYTMRLVEGETLKDAIAEYHDQRLAGKADSLAQRRLLDAFVSVSNAISYAHSRGVLHRDLKPQNVILGGFGEAIVLDWGLAKLGDKQDEEARTVNVSDSAHVQATAAGQVMGTPAYMAPEQAAGRGDEIDVRTDVYGLGAILFEILTGQPPHRPAMGEGTQKFLRRIATDQSPRTKLLDSTIPRPLDVICAKAMAKTRDDRYADAKALLREIQHWLADEPVEAYRESPAERLSRWMTGSSPMPHWAMSKWWAPQSVIWPPEYSYHQRNV